jgi:hypothetical protein
MENDMLDGIMNAALPYVLEFVGVLLSGVLLWVARQFHAKTGIEIEARHREALHSAIMTGLRHAAQGGAITDRQALAREAVEYARRSVPDAIKGLRAGGDVLLDLAESRLGDVIGRR